MANLAELTELQHRLTKATQANADAVRATADQLALLVEENRKLIAILAQMTQAAPEDLDATEATEGAPAEPQRYMDGTPVGR